MTKRFLIATASIIAMSGAVQAATATATTDLNIRSGPGPNYDVVGTIAADANVDVTRCLEAGNWCEVNYDGTTGWSYGEYLTAMMDEETVTVAANTQPLEVQTVQRETVTENLAAAGVGAATGIVAGALLAGPVGAAVGTAAAVGGATGAVIGADSDAFETETTYVQANPVEPVYLEGEVVRGAGIPQGVDLYTVPDGEVEYANINNQSVLVDPGTRQIVYVVR